MNKMAFAQLFSWFSFFMFIFFVIVETMYRGNTTLETIVYVLFAARGIIGLLTLTRRKPAWRIFDIVFNILWLLFGAVMLYFIYAE